MPLLYNSHSEELLIVQIEGPIGTNHELIYSIFNGHTFESSKGLVENLTWFTVCVNRYSSLQIVGTLDDVGHLRQYFTVIGVGNLWTLGGAQR